MKDAIVVLSHKCESIRLSKEYKKRMDAGIELLLNGKSNKIIICGKNSEEIAKKYLINSGINEECILTQEKSRNTIEEAFLTKTKLLYPRNWKKIIVVSSDYHIRYRAALIFDFIFGKKFEIDYVEVESGKLRNNKIIMNQMDSLNYFLEMFRGIEPGNDSEIERRLFEKYKI